MLFIYIPHAHSPYTTRTLLSVLLSINTHTHTERDRVCERERERESVWCVVQLRSNATDAITEAAAAAAAAASASRMRTTTRQGSGHTRGRRRGTRERSRVSSSRALFTGIVQGRARVVSARRSGESARLVIAFPAGSCEDVAVGASVSLNGTCLTATERSKAEESAETLISFDVVDETLRCTTLGGAAPGSELNFERSARLGDEVGGHGVSGHVCCTARVEEVKRAEDGNVCMRFVLNKPEWGKYLLPKGYVAVNGCSLTIGEVMNEPEQAWFTVYLIPETLRVTVFGAMREGDEVNVEVESQTQVIVDTVERTVEAKLAQLGASVVNS